MSVDISDLIKAVFNCKDIADARAADLQRVIDVGGRVDPDLAYEQDRREERFKLLLDRYIDERIKIAVGSDQRTIHDVSRSPLDVGDCGSHVRPAAEKCYEVEEVNDDPRERIETRLLGCQRMPWAPAGEAEWVIGAVQSGHSGRADWPEVVAFARAILAADEAWLDSRTPTLEELRAKYRGAMVEITALHIPGDDYLARLVTESESVEYAAPTVGHALRWLAAKLEALSDGK